MTAPRINFSHFHGFPSDLENGKIDVVKFLDAAQEIVKIIETFGKVYKPVVLDMNVSLIYKDFQNC
jgi:hypothetical protein